MNPIFAAIDMPDVERARQLANDLRGSVGGIKLGLEFFSANGPTGVSDIGRSGLPVFLDVKLHDIPTTVGQAMRALAPLKPAIVTVHAAGGRAMLEAAKASAPEGTKVVAVTVLTSLDAEDLRAAGVSSTPAEQVQRLAELARAAGVDGIVCSGAEVKAAHEAWPDGFFVVPGVRPEGSGAGDQKRVVSPAAAVEAGASVLVIGRPITGAQNPADAARAIAHTIG